MPEMLYSHSRLSSFEDCPRKFRYRYLLRIPAEGESIEGFVGKRVHEVLERLHRVADAGRVPSLPRVLERYREWFGRAYDPRRVRIVREEQPLEFYREMGEGCLRSYYTAHYPFEQDQTLALEERVVFDLGEARGVRVRVQGIVDRIARARDGAIEIQDYKTSARVPSQARLDADRQLALYQIGLERRYGTDQPVRLVWHYLRRGQLRVSRRSPEQLADLRQRTLALVERIRREAEWEARPGPLCRWCEYRDRCPASPVRRTELPSYEEAGPHLAARPAPRRARAGVPRHRARRPTQLALPLEASPAPTL